MRFRAFLLEESYSRYATKHYSNVARHFLVYLDQKAIAITAATPDQVDAYLRMRLCAYRRRHRRSPRIRNDWHWHLMSPIQALLRLAQGQWPPPSGIDSRLDCFRKALDEAGRGAGTVRRYIQVARRFLIDLNDRSIPVDAAKPADVSRFIDIELRRYRRKHGRSPRQPVDWRCALTGGIHELLRQVQGVWPPPSAGHPWLIRFRQHLEQECPDRRTRLHYLHACGEFLAYWEDRGVRLEGIEANHVTTYCQDRLRAYRKRHGRLPENLHRWRLGTQVPIHRLLRLMHGYWPPESRPDPSVSAFRDHLIQEGFSPTVIPSQLSTIRVFLRFLAGQHVSIEDVQPGHVASHLETRLAAFRRMRGRLPVNVKAWRYKLTGPIHRHLRLVRGQWPPEVPVTDELEAIRRALCAGYGRWLTGAKGLSEETLRKNGDAAHVFLRWLGERARPEAVQTLSVADIDGFLAFRNPGLRRATRSGVSHCLRSFLRYLYSEGFLAQDLAPHVPSPSQYRFEHIPCALGSDQVRRLLEVTGRDRKPCGRRDYAILLLLQTYGLRAGEVVRLRLQDIDWRRNQIYIRQSKTGADLWLPLMPAVGNALVEYLRHGRPASPSREVFLKLRAPRGPFMRGSALYSVLNRRLKAGGIEVEGRRGPHALRYARAVELLRASTSLKSIGDLLGHRSATSTEVYLKLSTEDLRSISLDVPAGAAP